MPRDREHAVVDLRLHVFPSSHRAGRRARRACRRGGTSRLPGATTIGLQRRRRATDCRGSETRTRGRIREFSNRRSMSSAMRRITVNSSGAGVAHRRARRRSRARSLALDFASRAPSLSAFRVGSADVLPEAVTCALMRVFVARVVSVVGHWILLVVRRAEGRSTPTAPSVGHCGSRRNHHALQCDARVLCSRAVAAGSVRRDA